MIHKTKLLGVCFLAILLLSGCGGQKKESTAATTVPLTTFALGEDRSVDVFLICPTVDTRSDTNALDLNEKLKGRFVNALEMERGIFDETDRLYFSCYRQMSIKAYALSEEERVKAREIAYLLIIRQFYPKKEGL